MYIIPIAQIMMSSATGASGVGEVGETRRYRNCDQVAILSYWRILRSNRVEWNCCMGFKTFDRYQIVFPQKIRKRGIDT
ncbi:hypothetical protein Hanom_Chr09g00807641 [Helianthus anomalus]